MDLCHAWDEDHFPSLTPISDTYIILEAGESMINLLNQYKNARRGLNDMLDLLEDTEKDIDDKSTINSMIRDVTFIIDWIESGSNPEELRGTNIKNAYHIKYLPNMEILPDITDQLKQERESLALTKEQKNIIYMLFDVWTDRERDCFILYVSENKSMGEVADELNLSKPSVQTYIKRAKEKVELVKGKRDQLILL